MAAAAAFLRPAAEVAQKWNEDPLARCAELLRGAGVQQRALDDVVTRARLEMEDALAFARAAPYPGIEQAFSDIQDLDWHTDPTLAAGVRA